MLQLRKRQGCGAGWTFPYLYLIGVVVLSGLTSGIYVHFLAQRQSPGLGNPDLSIGLLIRRFGIRAVQRRRSPLTDSSRIYRHVKLLCWRFSLILLHHLLRCDRAASPFATDASDEFDDRNSFQNLLILIGFLGAINHNDIDGTFLCIQSLLAWHMLD